MPKARARYTQSDVLRILKAAAKMGVAVRVKIDTRGNILIATGNTGSDISEWDEEYGEDRIEAR
jgi:hypothetical protein